jgi:hypothetical protein
MPLSEGAIRYGASTFTIRPGEGPGTLTFGPELHRMKDIPRFIITKEDILKSEGLSTENLMGLKEDLMTKFPEAFKGETIFSAPIGEYNPVTALSEDYDYWLRVSKRFTMHPLQVPLYYYRLHSSSLSAQCVDRVHRRARRLARKRSSYPFWQYILPNIEDTDFILTANVTDLTNYKNASNVISCRVYQLDV